MKTHTQQFKNAIKTFGRELDSKIIYDNVELGGEQLNSISPHYQGGILKSVMKELEIDSNVEIPVKTILAYKLGVKTGSTYEYIDFGNYVVKSVEKQEDTGSYLIKCCDKMLYSMKEYKPLDITYPISIRDYINALCQKLGLVFADYNKTFANYDKLINQDLYVDQDYTYRDVFDELSQVTAGTICLNKQDQVEIRYINDTKDTIDEEFLKDINVNFKEKVGKINSIVLSRSGESDNIYYRDEQSVIKNGLCEIKIVDNQIMNYNDRDTYLPAILEKLNGLEYYLNDFSSTGICYYDLCDKYNVKIGDKTYSCIMFNDEINVAQGLEENVYTDKLKENSTDYTKADKTDRKINQAYIIVDKQKGEINALVSKTQQLDTNINNNYQDILKRFDGVASTDDLENYQSSMQVQIDSNKAQITSTEQLIANGVPKVNTTTGTFDINGLTMDRSGAKTSTLLNEIGVDVKDKQGTGEDLLFAGYVDKKKATENTRLKKYEGQTVTYSNNMIVDNYFEIGDNSRLQDYEDGGGVFVIGGY